jgi:hypothetical protein
MIGNIVGKNSDGTYQQGPIPGIGGPFNTATEFFKAWAAGTEFGMTVERLQAASGQYADEIMHAVRTFPTSVSDLAEELSTRDHGPFPLCHGDLGHNKIVVDDAMIDWEMACAVPWEVFAEFLLNLSMVPQPIDAPGNHDEEGNPVDAESLQWLADRRSYVTAVRQAED